MKKYKSSVKVMRSHDYCHFEINLGTDEELTLDEVDNMRKEAARLADKAVSQYQIMKKHHQAKLNSEMRDEKSLKHDRDLALQTPEGERTESQKACIKSYDDHVFLRNNVWDYQDWWYDHFNYEVH